ncbi:hypothetical protein [Streptomyces sp. NPDC008150]|uniref:Rv1733c family protein n=1 Tax=Streptomyces sp. NPDC008150 TaxID=3364816 RepID=UPI0036EEABD2
MRAVTGVWRWRRNPLRRPTDLAEAWLALVSLLLLLTVAPLVGALVGSAAQHALQQSVRVQHRTRHQVTATVVRELEQTPAAFDPDGTSAREIRNRVTARWTAPDGTARQGRAVADLASPRPGDRFAIWTDGRGRVVGPPLDGVTATTHAVLAGVGSALLAAGLVEGARRTAVWRMVRRRHARWDRAWLRAGPDWGRTGAGS